MTIRELISMAGLSNPRAIVSQGQVILPDGYVLDPHRMDMPRGLEDLDLRQWDDWRPVSKYASDSECVATSVVMWLLSRKIYGGENYYPQALRRIRAQRTRAKALLSLTALQKGARGLAWGISGRLVVRFSDGEIDYQVGQSENEEITNIMRRLVDPCAEYVS